MFLMHLSSGTGACDIKAQQLMDGLVLFRSPKAWHANSLGILIEPYDVWLPFGSPPLRVHFVAPKSSGQMVHC